MDALGSGHTYAEVEASAMNLAAALSGWTGALRCDSYKLQQMPPVDQIIKGSYVEPERLAAAARCGDTLYAWVTVYAETDKTDKAQIDLNPVLAEALQAIALWETAETNDEEHAPAFRLTEAVATIDDVLRNGGTLPHAWSGARAGRLIEHVELRSYGPDLHGAGSFERRDARP
jgi:hypothetical protein